MNEKQPSYERYQRQVILSGFGEKGQQQLLQARVLVVGAGGLGCPALQYLVAAGIGRIGIVDDDAVAIHNLHRQVLYTTEDIGKKKAETAAAQLRKMNPDCTIAAYPFRLTSKNAASIISDYEIVLDATDNFATRYLVNDACVLLNKPLVYGAISQFEGQVAVFNVDSEGQRVNYRDLFPEPPQPGTVLNCAEAGVLGVLPGIIGTLQATEVIKLVTGIGRPLANQLFTYHALTNESIIFSLAAKKETASLIPESVARLAQRDYEWLCEASPAVPEMDAKAFNDFLAQKNAAIIDVREQGEQPEVTEFLHRKLPLSTLQNNLPQVTEDTVIVFCQSGKRSREAARQLAAHLGPSKKIYSLRGGIQNWKNHGKENT